MEGASNCTDSVYMDAIQTPASASNAVVTAPCAVCTSKGDASKVTTATNTLAVVGSTSQSPSKLWNEAQEQLRNELNNITSVSSMLILIKSNERSEDSYIGLADFFSFFIRKKS